MTTKPRQPPKKPAVAAKATAKTKAAAVRRPRRSVPVSAPAKTNGNARPTAASSQISEPHADLSSGAPPRSSRAEPLEEDDVRRTRESGPPPAVVAQIRELEAQLDRLIDEASRRDLSTLADDDDIDEAVDEDSHPTIEQPIAVDVREELEVTRDALPEMVEKLISDRPRPSTIVIEPPPSVARRMIPSAPPSEATVFDTARELLSSDFYLRKWGRLAMRGRSEEVDDFGFDPIYEQKARNVLEFLYTRYFRVETTGIDRVPARGRCLIVANHSGTLPLDGVMIKTAVKLEHSAPRDVRWLTEDFIYHMPYLGSVMNRLGAVRACQENAERLLSKEQLVAVFPEGVKGIGKLFAERYRLQRFGRGGFIKLCLRTGTPIVPVAVVGAEETNPLLFRIEYLSKALGLPYVPVTPTFPALGPLGLLPAPTKWQIHFGEPIDFGAHGRDAADDELLVGKLAERVRATIQTMLDRAVGARKSVFF